MCGIAGLVRAEALRTGDSEAVGRMAESLRHRGPDGDGVLSVGKAVLGHRRLAVVDLSPQAAQPMASPCGRYAISYNGEVYNHLDLRVELEAEGRVFQSASDTEVVLAACERWGHAAPERLNGMFSFALWDEAEGQLLLARDRYGQKPLYYTRTACGGIAFASEVRALLTLPEQSHDIDRRSIAKYLALDCFPGRTTAYVGIEKLPPGHTLTWRAGEVTIRRYWERRYGGSTLNPDEAAEELWRLLCASVRRRLMSDVPLGVFLSGGVDSSAILAAMATSVSPERICTFSIGFRESSFDESDSARQVAKYFGVEHREHILDGARLLELLPEILDHLDLPLADVSIVPTYALSKFAREHVTVALGGDGGDELFAGYDTFLADQFARPYLRVPAVVRSGVARLVDLLPPSKKRMSLQMRAQRFVRGLDADPVVRNLRWFGSFLPEEAAALVQDGPSAESIYEDLFSEPYPQDQPVVDLWTRWYLPDDVLTKVDRASMAVSLEVRAPFLDPDLAAFAHSLPYRYKVRGLARKWIFKRALEGRLPASVLRRKKQGFGAPNGEWLRGPLRAELMSLLEPSRMDKRGLLRSDIAARIANEHLSGRRDHRKRLWALYVLQRWLERQAGGSA